jgi:hypothetical protein
MSLVPASRVLSSGDRARRACLATLHSATLPSSPAVLGGRASGAGTEGGGRSLEAGTEGSLLHLRLAGHTLLPLMQCSSVQCSAGPAPAQCSAVQCSAGPAPA